MGQQFDIQTEIDVKEDDLLHSDPRLLKALLQDKTTRKNIVWATSEYVQYGSGYEERLEIMPEQIIGEYRNLIQPRITKELARQAARTRDKAEVFTPSWVCNKQNNLIDASWFGKPDVFNTETEQGWTTNTGTIAFDNPKKPWNRYVDAQRLEITCGEAPYLVSRYDTVDGHQIPIGDRIGLLDRKLRVVNENTSTREDWIDWTIRAFQSVFGYEYQGDNLLLARENLLLTFVDYYRARFHEDPEIKLLLKIANIIAWNIWQMDGLTGTVPFGYQEATYQQMTLFDFLAVDQNEEKMKEAIPCRIFDWRTKESVTYNSLKK